ncbi:DEAD domain-containing protein [Cephalotus follicularis]|uniref:DEAD domain-containing protein n=1 Tax=Cephalotus follicularis TaxID=3775 RepID=A0A1Q3ARQ3_CEPFO|nr:DEAD domain-containing protein [Cephalotus follicularis]
MAKGDDVKMRKKTKANRKKQSKDSSNVSARIAAMIAAKKRRKSGKRRMCQGMCFSLPTPDDPFNDRHDNENFKRKETKKNVTSKLNRKTPVKRITGVPMKDILDRSDAKLDHLNKTNEKIRILKTVQKNSLTSVDNLGKRQPGRSEIRLYGKGDDNGHRGQASENSDCPSKFLILCLNAIENGLRGDGTYIVGEEKRLFVNPWGVEFWKCYSVGMDILETTGSSATVEQIAWMASSAADTIARKEKEGLLFSSPFLLFLVPSQEKAAKVRLVCKPLKALGIHTVSLHPGASVGHQINGLKTCEPEFLVSTPERLLELVSLKAVDISGVSLMVVDGLECHYKGGYLDCIKSITQCVSGKFHSVVFDDCFSYASTIQVVQNLLMSSIYRLSLTDSVASQSACIMQSVDVCTLKEEKLSKAIQILDHSYGSQIELQPIKVLFVVEKGSKFQNLASILKVNGYSVSIGTNSKISKENNSSDSDCRMRPEVSMIDTENISSADLGEYELVIIPDFVLSIKNYVQIVTRMARHTVNGVLHSFLAKDDAPHAGPLIEILEQCGQAVPEALRNLSHVRLD